LKKKEVIALPFFHILLKKSSFCDSKGLCDAMDRKTDEGRGEDN
jgi:hypothetical protein